MTLTFTGYDAYNTGELRKIFGPLSHTIVFLQIFRRDHYGRFFTILESPVWADETSGLSFSPDGKHLYVAYQENGILYDVTREDGLAFNAKFLDVKYHNTISSRRLNSQWIGH